MNWPQRSVFIAIAGLLSLSSRAEPQLDTTEQRAIEDLTTFQVYHDQAFRMASEGDPDKWASQIQSHLKQFQQKVEAAHEASSGRMGTGLLLRAQKSLWKDESALHTLAAHLIERFYAPQCATYVECLSYIKDLSDLTDIVPEQVHAKILELNKLPTLAGNSYTANALRFRTESLDIAATFFASTHFGSFSYRGRTPRLSEDKLLSLKDRLNQITTQSQSLALRVSELDQESTFQSLSPELKALFQREATDSLQRLNRANDSLQLYLNRINQIDIENWLQNLRDSVSRGETDRTTALFTLVRFAQTELSLPWRREWVLAATELGQTSSAGFEGFEPLLQNLSELLESRETEILGWLTAFGLNENSMPFGERESLAKHLIREEKNLARRQSLFESLHYQILKTQNARSALLSAATQVKLATGQAIQAAQDAFQQADDDAAGNLAVIACYAYTSSRANIATAKIKFPWSHVTVDLKEFCPVTSLSSSNDLESHVWQSLAARRGSTLYTTEITRFSIDSLLTIPVIMGSFGAGEVIGKTASVAVTRWGTALATRYASNKVTAWALTKGLPYAAYGVTGGLTFTLVKRAGYAAIGYKPIYNAHLSLYDNYGLDLLFGGVGFFFLPYYEGVGWLVNRVQKLPLIEGKAWAEQSTYYLFGASADCALFASLPVVDRVIRNHINHTNDPVLKDAGEAGLIYVRAYDFSMSYRIIWKRLGPWLARRFPVMYNPAGTSPATLP